MKKIAFIFIAFLFSSLVYSQTNTDDSTLVTDLLLRVEKKNAVYAEFLGNGFAYSLNYERQIYSDEKLAIGARIGIAPGFIPMFTGFGLPLEANVSFLRKNGHMAEAGPGFTWFYGKSKFRNENRELINSGYYNVCDITLRIGYKYVGTRGLLIRAAFIPTFAVVSPSVVRENNFFPMGKTFTPWGGISVGYVFK